MLAGPYLGTYELSASLAVAVLVENSTGTPSDPAVAPTYRIYGPNGLMTSGAGSLSKFDTHAVTGASNAAPIAVTAAGHGLQTGVRVNVAGVGGCTAANTETTITFVDPNTFTLDGTTGNGAYTSGGTVHVAGLYRLSLTLDSGAGYEAGQSYQMLVSWTLAGVNYAMACSFDVA